MDKEAIKIGNTVELTDKIAFNTVEEAIEDIKNGK